MEFHEDTKSFKRFLFFLNHEQVLWFKRQLIFVDIAPLSLIILLNVFLHIEGIVYRMKNMFVILFLYKKVSLLF